MKGICTDSSRCLNNENLHEFKIIAQIKEGVMSKPTRDEIRDRLNKALQDAETKKSQLDILIQQYRQEKDALKSEKASLITTLTSEFRSETQKGIDELTEKNSELEEKISALESEKEALSKDKELLVAEIKSETKTAINQISSSITEAFKAKQEEERNSWFNILKDWSQKQHTAYSEKLDLFVKEKTGRATNIVSQDILSAESRELANEKGKKSFFAEIGLIIALVLMVILGLVIYYTTTDWDVWKIIYKALLFVPFGFYIWLQTSKIRRETCLRDQFHHKQLVMASYSAFIGFLQGNKAFTPEKQLEMTEHLFTEVRDNSADKADKHEITKLKTRNKLLSDLVKEMPKLAKHLSTKQIKDLTNKIENESEDIE